MRLVVGIDVATATVRAVAMDGTGEVHARAESPLPPPESPAEGWFQQDAGAWWPALQDCLRRLTSRLGTAAGGIRALSIAATSGTVVALDASGEPLGPALTYADQRAVVQATIARQAAPGTWRMMGLAIQPSFGLPKMGWLASGVPGVHRLAHQPDLLVAKLIGREAPTDWSHALKSGYDPAAREWVGEALTALGIRFELLPEVRPPVAEVGTVSLDASEVTGLPESCLVKLGMTDGCAAQLAAGAGSPGRFVSVLGSTLVLKGVSHQLLRDPQGAIYSHRHPQGWWLPGGASSAGGLYLEEHFAGQDFAELDRRAARHGPAQALIYPLVGVGERFPWARPEFRGFAAGDLSDPVEHYRAALEGVAFVERCGYERLRACGADVRKPVAAAGRGSASLEWSRIRATVLGVPLLVVGDASTARGAAMIAAAGILHPDLATASRRMVAKGELVEPNPDERQALNRSYQSFRRWSSAWQP